jgi:hypothetical protein
MAPGSSCSTPQQAPSGGTFDGSQQPLTTLRGAPVAVDSRRATRLVVTFCLAALGLAVVSLFVAGIHKNAQITLLRQHGVGVEVTVTGCRGLLGGSGSNAVGATCRGIFVLDGRSYSDTIPGDTLRAPGTTLRLVTAESDPGVVATVHQAETEHASWTIFLLPSVLLIALLALLTSCVIALRRGSGARQFSGLRWRRDLADPPRFWGTGGGV